ncbi:DNA-directed RNA polymerases I and III subunit RPAC2 [Nematocida displodere]|uniref:DNA-directed RNA polymerases I and III subunit RPAC2 n=1 Tax=Nematocida displodere TaxID=1805483 RepID=A0A177EJT7_9MICR|nr:DNA-directed RNA polymerases I and III subunit RPAC2 [Nematocida displodere]
MRVQALDEYTIEVLGEKHTLLNLIRWSICEFEKTRKIELVGYTIPHPMEDRAIVKIQLQNEQYQTKQEIMEVLIRGIETALEVVSRIDCLV